MRRLWVAAGLLLCIFCVVGFGCFSVSRHLASLRADVQTLDEAAALEQPLSDSCEALRADWARARKVLCVFLAHEHAEPVSQEMDLLILYCDTKQYDEVRASCRRCLTYFEDMKTAQWPLLENLF